MLQRTRSSGNFDGGSCKLEIGQAICFFGMNWKFFLFCNITCLGHKSSPYGKALRVLLSVVVAENLEYTIRCRLVSREQHDLFSKVQLTIFDFSAFFFHEFNNNRKSSEQCLKWIQDFK